MNLQKLTSTLTHYKTNYPHKNEKNTLELLHSDAFFPK
jgi:hypothetical protein